MATPITPSTNVFLLKCPLEMDNNHQLNFASKTAQYNYFSNLPKIEFEDFSYQRQDGILRVPYHIDSLYEYNYIMYQNENYTDKWFYAFVTGMEYVNDHCTFISIKTDVYQTWQFDVTFRKCFVEREHVNNDTFGLHTLEENIPSGEWVNNDMINIGINPANQHDCWVMCAISDVPKGSNLEATILQGNVSRVYNSIPSGCFLIGVDITDTTTSFRNLNEFILFFDQVGKGDAIINMFLVPKSWVGDTYQEYSIQETVETVNYSFDIIIPRKFDGVKEISNTQIFRNTLLDGYAPKNNKCFSKQFNYLLATNNVGKNVTYYWEDFTGTPEFKMTCAHLTQNVPSCIAPNNYKKNNASGGYNYSLAGAPLPIVSWKSDYYLNWQAQNGWGGARQRAEQFNKDAEAHTSDMGQYFGKLGADLAMGMTQTAGAVLSTINGSMATAERKPDPVHGDLSGDFTYSIGKCCFTFYKMSVRAEVAKIIDDYFSAYGYKVSAYKVPNITGRANWNYVKCIDVNVLANIPQIDLEEFKSLFNNGITIWHNPSTFLDYTQNNNIL